MTVAVVTGATRGIGRAAAVEFARRGAAVLLVGRDPQRVRSVAKEATDAGAGGPVDGHVADLFLLTNLLRDRLAGGRVVTTASGAHRSGRPTGER